ncbi:alpha/beta hydrolase [Sphingobium sufflavum]|uniref:alpha/beta hydrolase n=1 Tax=Sphingobium sufflavum TaxID=1129547 RepID=UPI001F3213D8|nr:alpha/beta hydrolase [Sphingobium sufflavum]MCE7797137.1 alpha/beta hydrolase [Sphingobium sufflavum]
MSVSHHLVDPELIPGLDLIPSIDLTLEALPHIRQQMLDFAQSRGGASMAGVTTTEEWIASPDGHAVRVLLHRPDGLAPDAPALVYAHGGGFLLGSVDMVRTANQTMALEAGCLLLSVDYRLPPEVPYPGPLEDCYTVLKWVHDNAAALGVDARRIAVAGESAGGGLAAALALLARDRGEVAVIHQHLIYPMLDDRTCRATASPYAGEFVWTPEQNQLGWSCMLGDLSGGAVPGHAAPARAEDLAGLPPAFIAVGAIDLFAEEDMEYARRLMRAGVPTELHVYPGGYHGFELAAEAAVTKQAHQLSIAALRRGLSNRAILP